MKKFISIHTADAIADVVEESSKLAFNLNSENPNKGNQVESKEYIEKAVRTDLTPSGYMGVLDRIEENGITMVRLEHAAMGLVTEAGELLDVFKKFKFYGKPVDLVNYKEELGDILWYVALACNELGVTFDELQQTNIEKLLKRFPDKFSQEKALNRDLEAERKVLEA